LVAGPLHFFAPLRQCGITIGSERFGGGQSSLHAGGSQGGQKRFGDGLVDLQAAH
jgi:hypothetical protein